MRYPGTQTRVLQEPAFTAKHTEKHVPKASALLSGCCFSWSHEVQAVQHRCQQRAAAPSTKVSASVTPARHFGSPARWCPHRWATWEGDPMATPQRAHQQLVVEHLGGSVVGGADDVHGEVALQRTRPRAGGDAVRPHKARHAKVPELDRLRRTQAAVSPGAPSGFPRGRGTTTPPPPRAAVSRYPSA